LFSSNFSVAWVIICNDSASDIVTRSIKLFHKVLHPSTMGTPECVDL